MPADDPYVGPRPFERADARRFFGRQRDARELASLVVAHRVVLLYSPSGAGKSSLVNAGVAPLLERKGFEVLPAARVGVARAASAERNPFVAAVAEQLGSPDESVAGALARRARALDDEGEPVPRALVLDQFEELFTARPDLWAHRPALFDALREALDADPRLRLVLVLREEYVAGLEPYAARLPGSLRTRFRLERLDAAGALEAVVRPLEGTERSFAPGVAESLVAGLLTLRVETAPGTTVEVRGEFAEPVHLQVVCARLWEGLPADVKEIGAEHVAALADLDTVLARFYDEALAAARVEAGVPERRLRRWVQDALITAGGTRSTVYRGGRETAGLPNEAVAVLEEKRLVRAEQRAGALWYELTHDRLLGPIQRSNAAFAAATSRRRRRRAAAAVALTGSVLVALLAAALVALATTDTSVRPEPPVCDPCTAAIDRVELRPNVTHGDYLRTAGVVPRADEAAGSDEPGVALEIHLTLRGPDRALFPLTWQVVDARSGNIVAEAGEPLELRPSAAARAVSLWVAQPRQEGEYEVLLRVFRPAAPTGSQPLAAARSPSFAVAEAAPETVVTFAVVLGGTGAGTVGGPGIDCPPACTAQYPIGTVLALAAAPAPGSIFRGWVGIGCGDAPSCRLVVGEQTRIVALFERSID